MTALGATSPGTAGISVTRVGTQGLLGLAITVAAWWQVAVRPSDLTVAWSIAHHAPGPAVWAAAGAAVTAVVVGLARWKSAIPGFGLRQSLLIAQSTSFLQSAVPAGGCASVSMSMRMLQAWGLPAERAAAGLAAMATSTVVMGLTYLVAAVTVLGISEHLDEGPVAGVAAVAVLPFVAGATLLATLARSRPGSGVDGPAPRTDRWVALAGGPDVGRCVALWRTAGEPGRWRPSRLTALTGLVHVVQFLALVLPLMALQSQWRLPMVGLGETAALYVLARLVAWVPVLVGALGTVDAVLLVGLGALGVDTPVALAAVIVWRLAFFLPLWLAGLASLAIWRNGLRAAGPRVGVGEPWLGRMLHRAGFALASAGPWRRSITSRIFDRTFARPDPWNYAGDPYEAAKADLLVERALQLRPRHVLDLGCAEGHVAEHLLERDPSVRVTCVDVSLGAVTRARERLQRFGSRAAVLHCELSAVRPSGAVDLVLASEVLYYLGYPGQVESALAPLRGHLTSHAHAIFVHPAAGGRQIHAAAARALGAAAATEEVLLQDTERPVLWSLVRVTPGN